MSNRTNRNGVLAVLIGLAIVLAACSGQDDPPEGLGFSEDGQNGGLIDSSGTTDAPTTAPSSTVAPTTSSAPTTTVAGTPRPTNFTCSSADIFIQFDESVVLLDPTQASQGPFSIDVPAGTYDINIATWLGWKEEPTHTGEQWYFLADSGFTSPLSTDSSPSLVTADLFSGQVIGSDISSITLFHRQPGQPFVNSVHPLCIGFTRVDVPAPTTTAAPTTTTAAPTTTKAPTVAGPTTTTTTTTTAAPTTTTTAAPAVAAPAVDTDPPDELALTGAGDLSMSLGLVGGALAVAGLAAMAAARRKEDEQPV